MNRREAIAALTALPGVARISKADLKPSDVIVIECDGILSQAACERIKEQVEKAWPGQKALVLEKSLHLKVVSGSQE